MSIRDEIKRQEDIKEFERGFTEDDLDELEKEIIKFGGVATKEALFKFMFLKGGAGGTVERITIRDPKAYARTYEMVKHLSENRNVRVYGT